jgi:hypothetical protein
MTNHPHLNRLRCPQGGSPLTQNRRTESIETMRRTVLPRERISPAGWRAGFCRAGLVLALSLGLSGAHAQEVADFNLARTAAGKGSLPVLPSYQGWTNSLNDGSLLWWTADAVSGEIGWTVTNAVFQPYLTWMKAQRIRSVRLWNDNFTGYGRYNAWDQVLVDTLEGPPDGATNEANWVNRHASAPGLSAFAYEADLGDTFRTYGLRVRVIRPANSNDTNVGEIAVYGPRSGGPQTLTAARQAPTSTAASSDFGAGRDKGKAVDGVYSGGGFLSLSATNNPGTNFYYEVAYASPGRTVGSLALLWNRQVTNFCDVPSAWDIELVTGDVTNRVGTFNRELTPRLLGGTLYRLLYHYDLGQVWRGVTKVRLVVPEDNVANGLGIGIGEIEVFQTAADRGPQGFMLRVE